MIVPLTVQERFDEPPLVIDVGDAESETVGATATFETSTSVHGPQLLPSFDSDIVPEKLLSLSAHTLTEYVPDPGNVYEEELTGPDVPEPSVALELKDIVDAVFPPSDETWNKLLKLDPVLAPPEFVIVLVNTTDEPTVAEVGVTGPAVRSAGEPVTVTVTGFAFVVPPGPVQLKLKV